MQNSTQPPLPTQSKTQIIIIIICHNCGIFHNNVKQPIIRYNYTPGLENKYNLFQSNPAKRVNDPTTRKCYFIWHKFVPINAAQTNKNQIIYMKILNIGLKFTSEYIGDCGCRGWWQWHAHEVQICAIKHQFQACRQNKCCGKDIVGIIPFFIRMPQLSLRVQIYLRRSFIEAADTLGRRKTGQMSMATGQD